VTVREFQKRIEEIYYARDSKRGLTGTFMWFTEEVGELARALRQEEKPRIESEFADTLAWLSTLASLAGIDLENAAAAKYEAGCPRCGRAPCDCVGQAQNA